MPRKKAAKFKCARCGKAFGMAMHLGRHMKTIHGQGGKRMTRGHPVGRPPSIAGRLGLRNMSLDQLVNVIVSAKEEASRRIAEIQQVIQ